VVLHIIDDSLLRAEKDGGIGTALENQGEPMLLIIECISIEGPFCGFREAF